jgi:hypothetical protein
VTRANSLTEDTRDGSMVSATSTASFLPLHKLYITSLGGPHDEEGPSVVLNSHMPMPKHASMQATTTDDDFEDETNAKIPTRH